jgi:D-arginine dehydrogenase
VAWFPRAVQRATRVVVIGGGIAGVSTAAELARRADADVVLVEAEPVLAHHTTGRSASMYLQAYGGPVVRALTIASREEFDRLAADAGTPVLAPRPMLRVASPDGLRALRDVVGEIAGLRPVSLDDALRHCPHLRRDAIAAAAVDDSGAEIDVALVHQTYVRRLVAAGGTIRRSAPVDVIARRPGGGWRVRAGGDTIDADVVVDAAGAWADDVARLAGAAPVGLQPLRRTLFMSALHPPAPPGPLVIDALDRYYFRVDGESVLASPADETPSAPCDARPDELDVALGLERVNAHTTLGLRSVRAAWAGLRTCAAAPAPGAGARRDDPAFVWCAGQGGSGIKMAPALARAAAALALDGALPTDLAGALDPAALSPDRFPPPPT